MEEMTAMQMMPYHEVDKPEYLVIQFPSYKNVLMVEHYCSKPGCDCNEVLLTFSQLNEARKPHLELVQIRMDIEEGTLLDMLPNTQGINADEIVETFLNHFRQFQPHLRRHQEKVKQYVETTQGKKLPPQVMELIQGDNCVPYHKIFGNNEWITLTYNDQNYIIEDQYCMKPTCDCDEVVLVVFKENAVLSDFVCRLSFLDQSYELLKVGSNPDYESIITIFAEKQLDAFKSRYQRMKDVGKKFLA